MIKIYGIHLRQLPSVAELKDLIGKEWTAAWSDRHGASARDDVARASLGGLLLLRHAGLAGRLAYSEKGKPFLYGFEGDFSITHTGKWVFCAVSAARSDSPVGLDAESIERFTERSVGSLAMRWLLPREYALLQSENDGSGFLRLWTRKEALVKQRGEGLSCLREADTLEAERNGGLLFTEYQIEDVLITLCAPEEALVEREIEILRDASCF